MSAVTECATQQSEELRDTCRAVPPGGAHHPGPVPQQTERGPGRLGKGQIFASFEPQPQ